LSFKYGSGSPHGYLLCSELKVTVPYTFLGGGEERKSKPSAPQPNASKEKNKQKNGPTISSNTAASALEDFPSLGKRIMNWLVRN
jgi:hypothetical protein